MPGTPSLVHGLYPRSPDLVHATRDLDRDRSSPEAVEEVRRSDEKRLASVQAEAGVRVRSPGQVRWQDLARPLVEAADGLEVGPLTRFYETNTFYRAPRVAGEPRLDEPVADPGLRPPDGGQAAATLPGPWTLASWAVDADDPAGLATRLARDVLAPQAGALDEAGFDRVVLHEPEVAAHGLARGDEDALTGALDAFAAASPLPALVHTYMGPATGEGLPGQGPASRDETPGDALGALLDADVAGVGVDFLETGLGDVAEAGWGETVLLAGVVDARNSLVEDPETLAGFLGEVRDAADAPEIHATHTTSLEFVPAAIAEEKVRVLGEVGA